MSPGVQMFVDKIRSNRRPVPKKGKKVNTANLLTREMEEPFLGDSTFPRK